MSLPNNPCVWSWREYARDLNVQLMARRMYAIDRELERLQAALKKQEEQHEVGDHHPRVG